MNSSILIKQVDTTEELEQILTLQNQNHVKNLSAEQKKANGFLNVKLDMGILTVLNKAAPQIIAKDHGKVVGYALVMLKEQKEMIPMLIPMFEMLNRLSFDKKPLMDYNFYVMGQVCISDSHRGQGIFEALYDKHKSLYSEVFEICLTEISVNNHRSMKAHTKVGFQVIHNFKDQTDDWNIVLWNWNKK